MSVIKAKRQEGQLVVLTKAREMCAYTVAICKNEKNFPKRDRWIITQPIVTEALSIMSCIRRANSVRVETQDDYTYRRNQQVQALAHAEAMLTLMDIAYEALSVESDRIQHWTGLVLEVETLVQKWKRSDKARYRSFSHTEPSLDPADSAPTSEA